MLRFAQHDKNDFFNTLIVLQFGCFAGVVSSPPPTYLIGPAMGTLRLRSGQASPLQQTVPLPGRGFGQVFRSKALPRLARAASKRRASPVKVLVTSLLIVTA